eukprot:c19515_g1_i2.p1 GENE.c19515_g1_i2~~c19515_g1_i2.p1  ORF type:complete len:390 (+),score=158.58 c19515_g1_i2:84-1253(+)
MKLFVVVFCFVCSTLAFDHMLSSKCENWVSTSRRQMVMMNQVASRNHINSCEQYCVVAGSGFRPDTTICRTLCESVGVSKFVHLLSADQGSGLPETICNSILQAAALEKTPAKENVDHVHHTANSFLEVSNDQSSIVQRKVGIRGDVAVSGTISASVITSPIGDVKASGSVNVLNQISASSLRASVLTADTGFSIGQGGIVSKKDQLVVKGKIDAESFAASSVHSSSFLEISGVKQWSLHSLEDFDEVDDVTGWSHGTITECAGHHILGGHCVETAKGEVSKTFTNLPPHSQIRINAKYMFIDSWDGESGYLKADSNLVWTESYNHADGDSKHGINLCGNSTPERKFGRTIDVTVPHTGNSITLIFGATTDEHPCDESFGVDSVMVFTR